MSENEEKGFKIIDRRASSQEADKTSKPQEKSPASTQEEKKAGAAEEKAGKKTQQVPLPEASFLSLIFTFYADAQIGLGLVPNPLTKKVEKDLVRAKYLIDLLGILQEKTKGNLTAEEERTLEDILFHLRMIYVEELKK
ncbi:MAG TPA: DUF1844 domain-containing protein [Candidatus Limnocylindrales bacterium]|nr:DUF1844 domain-containing protein [Candidatus Limnocylindrales bacterium]